MARKLDKHERDRVIALGQDGKTVTEIMRETGVSFVTIRRLLDGVGISPRARRLSGDTRDRVVQLYLEGLGSTTVAKEVGISPAAALKILKESNVAMRPIPTPSGALKELPLELIADRYLNSHEHLTKLAEEYGVSYGGLRERLEADGLIGVSRKAKFNTFEFIQAWQEAASVREVGERLGMSNELASARATRYRAQGVPLKRFDNRTDWQELADFATLFEENGRRLE